MKGMECNIYLTRVIQFSTGCFSLRGAERMNKFISSLPNAFHGSFYFFAMLARGDSEGRESGSLWSPRIQANPGTPFPSSRT